MNLDCGVLQTSAQVMRPVHSRVPDWVQTPWLPISFLPREVYGLHVETRFFQPDDFVHHRGLLLLLHGFGPVLLWYSPAQAWTDPITSRCCRLGMARSTSACSACSSLVSAFHLLLSCDRAYLLEHFVTVPFGSRYSVSRSQDKQRTGNIHTYGAHVRLGVKSSFPDFCHLL